MLIWLGKQILEQKENPQIQIQENITIEFTNTDVQKEDVQDSTTEDTKQKQETN